MFANPSSQSMNMLWAKSTAQYERERDWCLDHTPYCWILYHLRFCAWQNPMELPSCCSGSEAGKNEQKRKRASLWAKLRPKRPKKSDQASRSLNMYSYVMIITESQLDTTVPNVAFELVSQCGVWEEEKQSVHVWWQQLTHCNRHYTDTLFPWHRIPDRKMHNVLFTKEIYYWHNHHCVPTTACSLVPLPSGKRHRTVPTLRLKNSFFARAGVFISPHSCWGLIPKHLTFLQFF